MTDEEFMRASNIHAIKIAFKYLSNEQIEDIFTMAMKYYYSSRFNPDGSGDKD